MRFNDFGIGELQHLLIGLSVAKTDGLQHSPIIQDLVDECSEALNVAVEEYREHEIEIEV